VRSSHAGVNSVDWVSCVINPADVAGTIYLATTYLSTNKASLSLNR
jgi:hypothetical protein